MNDNDQSDIDQKVSYTLIRTYMDQLIPMLSANILSALLVLYFFWNIEISAILIIWFLFNFSASLFAIFIARNFKLNEQSSSSRGWVQRLIPSTVIVGLAWGSLSFLLMDVSNAPQFAIFTILLIGVIAGGLYSLSLVPPLFLFFTLPMLSQYWIALYLEQAYTPIIFASLLLFILMLWFSRQFYQTNYKLHAVQFENEALISFLREEKELVEKASQSKTRFLAAASHDLRQPLQAQRLYVETIAIHAEEKAIRELGEKALASQRSMQKMLDGLLDLSRLDAGMMTPRFADVSLKRLFFGLEREFSTLAADKGLLFHLHWPPGDATVRSDPGMLESMLHNLISNAIRYTDKGVVMLAVRRRGSNWRLEVRDSGKGIAEEHQQEIFEEFLQLGNPERDREQGLGLGLSIVSRLAQLLEHELSLLSQPGRGSVFALHLPVGLFPAVEKSQQTGNVLSALSACHILVIDDEVAIRDGMTSALETYGCKVAQAANRQQAEAAVKQQRPDAMVVDYRLAKGENGIQLINHLKQLVSTEIPALLLTGDTAPDVLQSLEQSGIPVLHKPVALKKLMQSLQDTMEGAKST